MFGTVGVWGVNLLHLRQFSTWVYHTHVSALVHPLVHSLLYWSHLIQAWWQYWEKSIFDIASFLALFKNKGWIFLGAISLSVGCFRMQRGAVDPAALNSWAEAIIGHILHVSILITSIFAKSSKSWGQCTEHILSWAEISWQREKILILSVTLF